MRPVTFRRLLLLVAALALILPAAACGGDATDDADEQTAGVTAAEQATVSAGASVSFARPDDGATVTSPVSVEMSAENFTVEEAGEVNDNAGHLHIMIDADCVEPGEEIPSDESHQHFGDGSTSAELELAPGEHALCLQAADGMHRAYDLTDEITVTVE